MKLRVDGLGDEITPRALMLIFEQYGKVTEASIHSDGQRVFYGIVTMDDKDAEDFLYYRPRLKWTWRYLRVKAANKCQGPWLSPEWRPPKQPSVLAHSSGGELCTRKRKDGDATRT